MHRFINTTKIKHEWDIVRLNSLVDPVHLQLILAAPIPANSFFYSTVCWSLSGNGEFSIKTATKGTDGLNPVNPHVW